MAGASSVVLVPPALTVHVFRELVGFAEATAAHNDDVRTAAILILEER